MSALRAAWRVLMILGAFAYCLPGHLLARRGGRPSPWPKRFLRLVTRAAGFNVERTGAPIPPPALYVANHMSWVDILVLGGETGAAFVAKAEIARWPIIGWLTRQIDAIFVERTERGAVAAQAERVADRLRTGRPVSLFPEGTTGDGTAILPFRPSLLAAAVSAGSAVQPVAIDYGAARALLDWPKDESPLANALRILGHRGALPVRVRFLDPIPSASGDRKLIAQQSRAAIVTALDASGSAVLAV